MNQRQVRALLVGALVGAAVGGVYGLVLVTYRDMLAAQRAGVAGKPKPCGCKEESVTASPELGDEERLPQTATQAEFLSTAERARDIRKAHPEMRWQDAMRQAAAAKNGTPNLGAEVSE